MTFFVIALALLAVFRFVWNLAGPLVAFAGGIVGLIAERKYGANISGIQHGGSIAGQAWKWLGAILLASLLARLAWGVGHPAGRVVPYLALAAFLAWHLMYVGGHGIRQEGLRRGDWEGVRIGESDIRLSWVSAAAVILFGAVPALTRNPLTAALASAVEWAFGVAVLRFVFGVFAFVYLLHFVITTGSMVWTGYRSLRAGRQAPEAPIASSSEKATAPEPASSRAAEPAAKTVITCSQCGQKLSLPAGRGKLAVTCPKCSTRQTATT